jgi:hypothetical protein
VRFGQSDDKIGEGEQSCRGQADQPSVDLDEADGAYVYRNDRDVPNRDRGASSEESADSDDRIGTAGCRLETPNRIDGEKRDPSWATVLDEPQGFEPRD